MKCRLPGLIVASLLFASPAPRDAAAATPPYRVSGNLQLVSGPAVWADRASVTWFSNSPAFLRLVHPAYYVLRPDPSGKAVLTLEALSSTEVGAVEVAIDAESGFQLVAVGTTTAPPKPTPLATSVADMAIGAAAQTATASTSHRSGHYYTEWDDPFWIPVSTVQTNIDWYYDGYETTSFTGSDYRTWFSANGWHEIYPYINAHWDRTETKGVVDTGDRMQTASWFPLPSCGTSTIYYSYNEVVGWGDGHVGGTVTTWVNSGCAFLLSWNAGAGYN